MAQYLEKWEKDDDAKLVVFKVYVTLHSYFILLAPCTGSFASLIMFFIQGNGRAFSAGGDLKMFYEHRSGKESYSGSMYSVLRY